MKQLIYIFFALVFITSSCNDDAKKIPKPKTAKPTLAKAPIFSGENAFSFVEKQLSFGPRNPNSEGHQKMAEWLIDELQKMADTVYVQKVDLKAFDGKILKSTNIIASFNPNYKKRMFVSAHWDTRPFADQDIENENKPILGANDGASGVAILMEIAKLLKENKTTKGIDLIFFDAEDYGQPSISDFPYMKDSYCLGSQYWAKNPHTPYYTAQFGILLDMVGAKNAVFTQEGYSRQFANNYLQKVWTYAHIIGYGNFFSTQKTNQITDDHYYINTLANIPTIDIIQYDKTTSSGFGRYWHTHNDNIDTVDKTTLKAVGQTVTQVIYQFNQGNF